MPERLPARAPSPSPLTRQDSALSLPGLKHADPAVTDANPVDHDPAAHAGASKALGQNQATRVRNLLNSQHNSAAGSRVALSDHISQSETSNIQQHMLLVPVESQAARDRRVFNEVQAELTRRCGEFDQVSETGPNGSPGLTHALDFIDTKRLSSVLRHISEDRKLLQQSLQKSAITIMFDKLYLMSGEQEGAKWQLRLHLYPIDSSFGHDEPEQPHFHRWTLASKFFGGGYLNTNYEILAAEGKADENILHEYQLAPSSGHADAKQRPARYVGQANVKTVKEEVYSRGDVRHFPIRTPHSVTTAPDFMGTTLTLALTGQDVLEESRTFQKTNAIKTLPAYRYQSEEEFKAALKHRVILMNAIELSNDLSQYLRDVKDRDLTDGEKTHLRDCKEYNYLETSLVPALVIASLTRTMNTEFSLPTMNFLNLKIRERGLSTPDFSNFIMRNQHDLLGKKLSIEPANPAIEKLVRESSQQQVSSA